MSLSIILMGIGIICMIFSFFLKDSSKKLEKEVEELSLSIYQETNTLKKRIKVIEEELLLDSNIKINMPNKTRSSSPIPNPISTKKEGKPVNEILVQQVLELNRQGYPISDIKKMSTLSEDQILSIIQSNGGTK